MLVEIDGIPISTNKSLIACGGRLVHSSEARIFKAKTTLALSNQLEQQLRTNPALKNELNTWINEPLMIQLQVFSNWLTKSATIRKTDISNKEKLLTDCLFSVLNEYGFPLDDSQVYLMVLSKHEIQDKEKTVVIVNKLSDMSKRVINNENE